MAVTFFGSNIIIYNRSDNNYVPTLGSRESTGAYIRGEWKLYTQITNSLGKWWEINYTESVCDQDGGERLSHSVHNNSNPNNIHMRWSNKTQKKEKKITNYKHFSDSNVWEKYVWINHFWYKLIYSTHFPHYVYTHFFPPFFCFYSALTDLIFFSSSSIFAYFYSGHDNGWWWWWTTALVNNTSRYTSWRCEWLCARIWSEII